MIDVYALRVPQKMDRGLFKELLTHVDSAKRAKLLRFVREADQLRGLFADLLIRRIIMVKTGLKNKEIIFGTNKFGKPYLVNRPDFHFNVSHSGIWVVAAVDSQPVGIDVEQIGDVDLSISKNYFSEDEHNDLMKQPDKISYFFTLWTLKESYIKNLGKGLSQPLNSFSMTFTPNNDVKLTSKGKTVEGVSFAQYNIHKDYKMVLCANHNKFPDRVTMEPTEGLVKKFVA